MNFLRNHLPGFKVHCKCGVNTNGALDDVRPVREYLNQKYAGRWFGRFCGHSVLIVIPLGFLLVGLPKKKSLCKTYIECSRTTTKNNGSRRLDLFTTIPIYRLSCIIAGVKDFEHLLQSLISYNDRSLSFTPDILSRSAEFCDCLSYSSLLTKYMNLKRRFT